MSAHSTVAGTDRRAPAANGSARLDRRADAEPTATTFSEIALEHGRLLSFMDLVRSGLRIRSDRQMMALLLFDLSTALLRHLGDEEGLMTALVSGDGTSYRQKHRVMLDELDAIATLISHGREIEHDLLAPRLLTLDQLLREHVTTFNRKCAQEGIRPREWRYIPPPVTWLAH